MHVEIQVALNFFISFLYNKLPRRRVNQFGEELDKALKRKFQGHWYPEKPFKGSAFRCLKTALPLDPVFGIAAHESGMAMEDLQRNLPEELSIWIDPGEVSYRLGEKGCVKILYSESESSEDRADREIYRTFNPEAQCFKPIDSVASQLGSMSLSSGSSSSSSPFGNSPSPTYKSSSSPITGFLPKVTTPLTFTTATFAQTKFGSTKLKSNGKRSQRMSPTEFSSYIKQRAIIQQQQTQLSQMFAPITSQQRPRSLSPSPPNSGSQQSPQIDANSFLLLANLQQQSPFQPTPLMSPNQRHSLYDGNYLNDIFTNASSTGLGSQQSCNSGLLTPNSNPSTATKSTSNPRMGQAVSNANALSLFLDKGSFSNATSPVNGLPSGSVNFKSTAESGNKSYGGNIDNFNVGGMSYPNQHLLMAN
ncbi:protein Tob1-like [Parasteatoda tepidariorum]|uniref:protein Tob1-like n=1 Tax=Parasteatoda tepidariorum TaxID=114398 RepID=UPI00077F85D2|nr:protein Tob1-like [Parasteatoda tepidariorum]